MMASWKDETKKLQRSKPSKPQADAQTALPTDEELKQRIAKLGSPKVNTNDANISIKPSKLAKLNGGGMTIGEAISEEGTEATFFGDKERLAKPKADAQTALPTDEELKQRIAKLGSPKVNTNDANISIKPSKLAKLNGGVTTGEAISEEDPEAIFFGDKERLAKEQAREREAKEKAEREAQAQKRREAFQNKGQIKKDSERDEIDKRGNIDNRDPMGVMKREAEEKAAAKAAALKASGRTTWTCLSIDISPKLASLVKPKAFKFPKCMAMEVIVELDEDVYERLLKDANWEEHFIAMAWKRVDITIDLLAKEARRNDAILVADPTAKGDLVITNLDTLLSDQMEAAGSEIARKVEILLQAYDDAKYKHRKFQGKCFYKIGVSTLTLGAGIAIVAGSHGAALPLGIIKIVKDTVSIAKEVAKLTIDVESCAKLIQGEIAILEKWIYEQAENQGWKNVKELGLNAIVGMTGIPVPNLKQCEEHIKIHKTKIITLVQACHEMGKLRKEYQIKIAAWGEEIEDYAAHHPEKADHLQKARRKRQEVELLLSQLESKVSKVELKIEKENANHEVFEKALTAMKEGVSEWTGYTEQVGSLVVDIGLGMGDVSALAETIIDLFLSLEHAFMEFVVDKL